MRDARQHVQKYWSRANANLNATYTYAHIFDATSKPRFTANIPRFATARTASTWLLRTPLRHHLHRHRHRRDQPLRSLLLAPFVHGVGVGVGNTGPPSITQLEIGNDGNVALRIVFR